MKTFPLIISRRLINKLCLIDHKIATHLLNEMDNNEGRYPITFLDIDEQDSSCLTFIQANKACETLDIKDQDESIFNNWCFMDDCRYYNEKDNVYTKCRSKAKVGRIINILFPNKFENSIKGSQNKNDIESFFNKYKSSVDSEYKFTLIDIVSGDKIGYWYNYNRYANNDWGSLAGSCMKAVTKNYYNIYMRNPETVSLVIMYSDDSKTKIKARALLWKLEHPTGRFFMDRVYTNDYSDEQIFIDFAKKNNWLYKQSQSMGYDVKIIDPMESTEGKQLDMFAKINTFRYRTFPYFDTLALMNKHKLLIGNNYKHSPDRCMTYTNGGFQTLEVVFSKRYNVSINKRDAVYSKVDRDWIYKYDAVRVYNTGIISSDEIVAHKDSSKIVFMVYKKSNGDTVNKAFLKKHCVWSEYLNTWVYYESIKNVFLNIEKTEIGIEHKNRLDFSFYEINGEYYAYYLLNKTTKEFLTPSQIIKKKI